MEYVITNRSKYIIKHIGFILLPIGMAMVFLQFSGVKGMYPLDMTILLFSLLFQIIGWNEEFWFLIGREI